MLRARGYEESGVPAGQVGAWRRLALALDDRLGRFRFRRERYGLGHVLRAHLARTLGSKSWAKKLLLEQNEIDNRPLA
jgi:hypothetical protein